ncbi:hypothetical protein BC829DRAFT_378604 [Chytridium lagenaria]|nr:hypothetical protein BC829DRAFT_378604 [Chytridium lagenaria]
MPEVGDFDIFAEDSPEDVAAREARAIQFANIQKVKKRDAEDSASVSVESRRLRYILDKDLRSNILLKLDSIWDDYQCDQIRSAVEDAVSLRGGFWDTERHVAFPTRDITADEVSRVLFGDAANSPANWLIRTITDRILAPAALAAGFKTQDLELVDLFFVLYEDSGNDAIAERIGTSHRRMLAEFQRYEGGGTLFCDLLDPCTKQKGFLVKLAKGSCMVHDSKLLHAGVDIVRGRRMLCVGFMDSARVGVTQKWAGNTPRSTLLQETWKRDRIK